MDRIAPGDSLIIPAISNEALFLVSSLYEYWTNTRRPSCNRATRETGRTATSPEGIPLASSEYELSGLQLNEFPL